MSPDAHNILARLSSTHELLTTSQLLKAGISERRLAKLVKEGALTRVRRGLYEIEGSEISEHHDLIHVAKCAPSAVFVLLTALRFHEIGTQSPFEVWVQFPAQARIPAMDWPPLRVIRTRVPDLQTEGVTIHQLGGADVAITTPARTIADCFKHRRKLGIDVCVEALRETLRARKSTIAEISEMTKLLRVDQIARPYLEAMI